MKKEISAYLDYVRNRIAENNIDEEFLEMFLTRIEFYQHERLIHLIVTMSFAIMTIISFFMLITSGSTGALFLTLPFLALTVPYVAHYYFLENSVQELYKLYYEAMEKRNG